MKKTLAMILAVVMLMTACVAGTLAWLQDSTQEVKNTFTVGNIDIELNETTGEEYKMVPGSEIKKDPFVTVKEGSEACYVFVKITESENLDNFISYAVADDWKALAGVEGVYYREQAALTAEDAEDAVYSVLKGDKVAVLDGVTKDMMDAITNGTADEPTLTFKAAAVQSDNLTLEEAWAEAAKLLA